MEARLAAAMRASSRKGGVDTLIVPLPSVRWVGPRGPAPGQVLNSASNPQPPRGFEAVGFARPCRELPAREGARPCNLNKSDHTNEPGTSVRLPRGPIL